MTTPTVENWRPVVGLDGFYEVSDLGRVRIVKSRHISHEGRIMKPYRRANGYMDIQLCRLGKRKRFFVHRLVASAFIGPCPPLYEVNHKDLDKSNNGASNLEYLTRSENEKHAARFGRLARGDDHFARRSPELLCRGESHGRSKLTGRDVLEIRNRYSRKEATQQELADQIGVSRALVARIVRYEIWTHI